MQNHHSAWLNRIKSRCLDHFGSISVRQITNSCMIWLNMLNNHSCWPRRKSWMAKSLFGTATSQLFPVSLGRSSGFSVNFWVMESTFSGNQLGGMSRQFQEFSAKTKCGFQWISLVIDGILWEYVMNHHEDEKRTGDQTSDVYLYQQQHGIDVSRPRKNGPDAEETPPEDGQISDINWNHSCGGFNLPLVGNILLTMVNTSGQWLLCYYMVNDGQ